MGVKRRLTRLFMATLGSLSERMKKHNPPFFFSSTPPSLGLSGSLRLCVNLPYESVLETFSGFQSPSGAGELVFVEIKTLK